MQDLTRLLISKERLECNHKGSFKLTNEEVHYLNKVMRLRIGEKIYIINGEGALWEGIKSENNIINILNYEEPLIFQKKKEFLIGIAIAMPKNGFTEFLRMATEIGVDIIQPLISDRTIKKNLNYEIKKNRWDSIIKESVEQSERLWSPIIKKNINIKDWIIQIMKRDIVLVSITRNKSCLNLRDWLKINHNSITNKKNNILWNVIGPEGGWSSDEIHLFDKNQLAYVSLSKNILRTPTAALIATSIINQWEEDNFQIYSS